MTDFPNLDKLPPILQWGLTLGVVVSGIVAGLLGRRSTAAQLPVTDDHNLQEVARLKAQIIEIDLRRDLEKVVEASRVSLFNAISELGDKVEHDMGELETRMRAVENEMAEARGSRRRPVNPRGRSFED